MRLVTVSHHGHVRLGAMVSQGGQEYVLELSGLPANMTEFLNMGETAFAGASRTIASADERYLLPAADATLLAPVPRPGKIICLGHNYGDHMGKRARHVTQERAFEFVAGYTILTT